MQFQSDGKIGLKIVQAIKIVTLHFAMIIRSRENTIRHKAVLVKGEEL